MLISKFCIDLFFRAVRVHLFRFLYHFFQFSSIFGLLAQRLSITLKISLVHWSGPLHRMSSPKIASVLKLFRSQDLPVAPQGPFKAPHFVISQCSVRYKKYGYQDHSRRLKNFIGSVSEPFHSFRKYVFWVYESPLRPQMFLGSGPFQISPR